ncbi:hypothetical protein [Nocardioides humi]|uniref:hypothetical protein n=1 Tax=Nocardioides humi TaxID=449461 RepID=UPI0015E83B06|nr:hypothetical protein [Nocardioides humi]
MGGELLPGLAGEHGAVVPAGVAATHGHRPRASTEDQCERQPAGLRGESGAGGGVGDAVPPEEGVGLLRLQGAHPDVQSQRGQRLGQPPRRQHPAADDQAGVLRQPGHRGADRAERGSEGVDLVDHDHLCAAVDPVEGGQDVVGAGVEDDGPPPGSLRPAPGLAQRGALPHAAPAGHREHPRGPGGIEQQVQPPAQARRAGVAVGVQALGVGRQGRRVGRPRAELDDPHGCSSWSGRHQGRASVDEWSTDWRRVGA